MKILKMLVQLFFFCTFLGAIFTGKTVLWLGLFLISLLGAAIFGRFYCGYICPMNTVMAVTGKIAKKLHLQRDKVPKWLTLKYTPWGVLIIMVASVILSKKVLHHEIPILLILVLISILFTIRYEEWIFHNHICPYGALLNLSGRWAKMGTKVEKSQCIGCKKCETICPSKAIQVDNSNRGAVIDQALCHQCGECSKICPKDAIRYR